MAGRARETLRSPFDFDAVLVGNIQDRLSCGLVYFEYRSIRLGKITRGITT